MADWWIAYAQIFMMLILFFSGFFICWVSICCMRSLYDDRDKCWNIIEEICLPAYGILHLASLFTAIIAQIRINQLKNEPYELAYAVKLENAATIVRLCLVTIFFFSFFMTL